MSVHKEDDDVWKVRWREGGRNRSVRVHGSHELAKKILEQEVTESRLSYCTRAGEFSERVVPMTGPARRRGLEVLELIDRAIGRGFLPPAPRDKACGVCDFRPVCGPLEEQRIRHKDPKALADLSLLRSWP